MRSLMDFVAPNLSMFANTMHTALIGKLKVSNLCIHLFNIYVSLIFVLEI